MSGTIARPFLCIPRDFMSKGFSHQEIGWFMDLISRAQYSKQTVINGGREQILLPGQLCDAVSFFVDRWKVNRDKVMRFIKKLVAFSYLLVDKPTHQSKKAANVITVCHLTGKPRSEDQQEDNAAHQPHINRTSTAHKYKKGEGIQEEREDSCQPKGPDVWDGSFPETEPEAAPPTQEPPPAPSAPRRPAKPKGAAAGYSPEYERFWASCPASGRRGSKQKPFEAWEKLAVAERAAAMLGAVLWARRAKGQDPKYVEMVQTWVHQRRWETETDRPEPREFSDDPRFSKVSKESCRM